MTIYPYAVAACAALIASIFRREPEGRHRRQRYRSRVEHLWRLGLLCLLVAGLIVAIITTMVGHDNQFAAVLVLVALVLGAATAIWPILTAELRAVADRTQVAELSLATLLLISLVMLFAPGVHH